MLITFTTSRILLFRLPEASELLKIKANKNVLKIGLLISKNKNILSIIHPDIPLINTTINVINAPPKYNLFLFSFAILSAKSFKKLITAPMNSTGCGKLLGSPIKRSRRTVIKIKLKIFFSQL